MNDAMSPSPAGPAAPIRAVVIGAGGGIGAALVRRLLDAPAVAEVLALARRPPVSPPDHPKLRVGPLELGDEATIAAAAATAGPRELVIVATGLLHDEQVKPEKSWRDLDPAALARVFQVNAIGPALVAKHFLALLPRRGRAVFAAISARVGSIQDNRIGGWYGYRASKAALNQVIRTAAIELARSRPEALCVALHPGTVDTALSRPFQAGVPKGVRQTPDTAAAHLLDVLARLTPADTGGLYAWDGRRLPF